MTDYESLTAAYVKLAAVSHRKGHMIGRDKFLTLAAAAACHAGWLDFAAQCRELVLVNNRHHLVAHWETVPDALRSEDFQVYLKQLHKFCSGERAEHLLDQLGLKSALCGAKRNDTVDEYVLKELADMASQAS